MPNLEIDPEGVYFRALKDSFLWKKGAILESDSEYGDEDGSYTPINDLDVWDVTPNQDENISAPIIERNPEWFERVYPVVLSGGNDEVGLLPEAEVKQAFGVSFEPIKIK